MKIYCYYANIGNPHGQQELIQFWKERWAKEGWEPYVLGEDDARRDPRYAASQAHIAALPCLPTSKFFERAALERWLAFSQVDGAVADYDVFPMAPFPPQDFGGGFVCTDQAGGPGLIIGSRANFSQVADIILNYQMAPDDNWQGIPHIGDMRILWKHKHIYDKVLNLHTCYSMPGWETFPLIHFGNHYLVELTNNFRAMNKAQIVKRLVLEHYRQ